MSYFLGCVFADTSKDTPSAVFPVASAFSWQMTTDTAVVAHTFGFGDSKVEQRFYIGPGTTKFVVSLPQSLSPMRRQALVTFWDELAGPTNAFYYDAPDDSGVSTTRYTCIFDPSQALQWQHVNDLIATAQITLIVIPDPANEERYPIASTQTRFPNGSLQTALLNETQEVIPLLTITPRSWGNTESFFSFTNITGGHATLNWTSATATATAVWQGDPLNPTGNAVQVATGGASGSVVVPFTAGVQYVLMDTGTNRSIAMTTIDGTLPLYISDRYCQIGGTQYYPRLLGHQGISQQLGPSDDATFQLGNADRVFSTLKGIVNLHRADVQFCLFHVGTQTLLQIWRGEIKSWTADEGPVFAIQCSDSIYELTLQYPTRTIRRDCWKTFNDGINCPWSSVSGVGNATFCDKGFDTLNGCQKHGMDNYFGGIIANPQGVRIKDNGSNGRPTITATSIVSDTMYGLPLQEVYTNNLEMPVNCIIADGRDESDFYTALGIVGAGPIGSFGLVQNQLLDGQPQNYPFSPLEVLGNDPEPTPFSLDAGGSYQYPFKAAGVARLNIRRTDPKGIQPSTPDSHQMVATVSAGLKGWVWTAPGASTQQTLTNPIWVAVNAVLRAKGLMKASVSVREAQFDIASAIAAAAICDLQTATLVYNRNPVQLPVDGANMGSNNWTPVNPTGPQLPNETQFQFIGIISQQQPLRDWIDQILLNCLGYWSTSFGKIRFGIRENAGAVEAFASSNMLFKSYSEQPLAPRFNRLIGTFADRDFQFQKNTATYYDQDYANYLGAAVGMPRYEDGQINLAGTVTASQTMRILATRGREEIGGINEFEWKNAVVATWKTTVLALNTEVGQVVSVTHPAVAGGYGKFRIIQWVLNYDFSIQITARTVTDSMYDLTVGPKPSDVAPPWLPTLPNVATNQLTDWSPSGIAIPGYAAVGLRNGSTFAMDVVYSTASDGTLALGITAFGFAPATKFFTQVRPKIQTAAAFNGGAGGFLTAGNTYYYAICGADSNGNLSLPSNVIACTLPAGTNAVQLSNITYPAGSAGYYLFAGATRSSLAYLTSSASTLPILFDLGTMSQGGLGIPPDDWTNVRIRLKAKKIIRSGLVRSVVTAVDSVNGAIAIEPGILTFDGEFSNLALSVIGDPANGPLPLRDYVIWTSNVAGRTLYLTQQLGQSLDQPLPSVGQIIVVRTQPDTITSTTIGSGYWNFSADLPGGLPINEDAGRYLRIIGGTGYGQVRQIVSNTATTHTVSESWTITPDITSVYIIEESSYLWESTSGILASSNPASPFQLAINIPGLTASTTSILIIGVLTANGYESDEASAPFRELALLTSTDLVPSSEPFVGTWWNTPESNQPAGWIELNPFSIPSPRFITATWQSYTSGGAQIQEGISSPPLVLGPVAATSPGPAGSGSVDVFNGEILYLIDTSSGVPLATVGVGWFPYPDSGTGPVTRVASVATSKDTTINYGTYGYPGMRRPPTKVWTRYFYARFVGFVWAPTSGLYTFGVNVDDAANLYVNGKKLVSGIPIVTGQAMAPNLTYTQSGSLYLAGGRSYPVILEWCQMAEGSGLQFLWTPPGATSPSLVSVAPDPTLDSSTPLNGQGSIVPTQATVVAVTSKTGTASNWACTVSWQGGLVPRADQSALRVISGSMTWSGMTMSSIYIYPYVDPATGVVHVASGDAPIWPPSTPMAEYALACYYDGRIPLVPVSVAAPVSAPAESGSISANPNSIASGSTASVALTWSSSGAASVAVYEGSPSGLQVATGTSGTHTVSSVTPGTSFYVVDTGDAVVLASVMVAAGASSGGGGFSNSGPGSQGGGGICPEENCFVYLQGRGVQRIGDAQVGDWIRGSDRGSGETVYRKIKEKYRKHSSTWRIVEGERVSPHHDVSLPGSGWTKPYRLGPLNTEPGWRAQITVDAPTWDDHNFHVVDSDGITKFTMHNYYVTS